MSTISSFSNRASGPIRLSQDIGTLIDNRLGSDVQFKVGGGNSPPTNEGENANDNQSEVTIYAHSAILRCRSTYFANIFDSESWAAANGIIHKPNISPNTFREILYFIYTGNVRAKKTEDIVELIEASVEMGLEELSIKCQSDLILAVKFALSDEEYTSYTENRSENDETQILERLTESPLPVGVAVRTLIIPALALAKKHTLSNFLDRLLSVILPRMTVICESPEAYTEFINGVSSQTLAQIISSDHLAMEELDVWELALEWACRRTRLLKAEVEASLKMRGSNTEDSEYPRDRRGYHEEVEEQAESTNPQIVSSSQLRQLKNELTPLLPAVRFSLLEHDDYRRMVEILSYFLSRRRAVDLQRFFHNQTQTGLLDVPRIEYAEDLREKILSRILLQPSMWKLLRKHIFETRAVPEAHPRFTQGHLKFELLFRASEHGFLAFTFHQRCDNKGPTLTIIRTTNGSLFGGVNFSSWLSDGYWSTSPHNFLFALPDGHFRTEPAFFRIRDQSNAQYAAQNTSAAGPVFGNGNDLRISNCADSNLESHSKLPGSYMGSGASNTSLAGMKNFTVADYEVFSISYKYK